MSLRRWILPALAALLLPAGALTVETDTSAEATAPAANRGAVLLSLLHQSGQHEMARAALVKARTDSAEIKSFADQMIKDHRAVDDKIVTFAGRRGIDLDAVRAQIEERKSLQTHERRAKAVGSATGEWAFSAEPKSDPLLTAAAMGDDHASLDKLRALSGAELNRAFIQQVIEHHKTVIDRVTEARVEDPQVTRLVDSVLPVFEHHLAAAKALQEKVAVR